ncbi:MAG: chorismate mutase [Asticcacaulis sp.]
METELAVEARAQTAPTLQDLRLRIDALDTELLKLIDERSALAADIAAAKAREGGDASGSLLRPDREAMLLRKLTGKPRDAVSDAAVVAIWRELISESLRIQGAGHGGLRLVFWAGDKASDLLKWSRERFGAAPGEVGQAEPVQVIAAARDPRQIGILGLDARAGAWWARLLAEPQVRVICALPERAPDRPKGFAIASLKPEPTGDDVSYWVTDSRLSEAALIALLGQRGLAAEAVCASGGMKLFALSGYVQEHDGRLDPAADKSLGTLSGIIGTSPRI